MRVEQTWEVDKVTKETTFTTTAFIGGEVLQAKSAVSRRDFELSRVPMHYIEDELRRRIMREIESRLFGGVR